MATKTATPGLRIRKHANKSTGERVTQFDPDTGERKLVNPATPGTDHESWPLAGISIEGDPPKTCTLSTTFVTDGLEAGWIVGEGGQLVVRPGGPADNPMRPDKAHTFAHFDTLVFHTIDGAKVRYKVTHQPDKYVDSNDPGEKVTDKHYAAGNTRVDHFYRLDLEG